MNRIGALNRWTIPRISLLVLVFVVEAAAQTASTSTQPTAASQHVKIAFVEVERDPRYRPIFAYERIILKPRVPPFAGAEVGVDEAAPLTRILNTDFTLERLVAKSSPDVASMVLQAANAGTHFFLIDVPAEAYQALAAAVRGRDILLFNVSEPDDDLRRKLCAGEFVHVYPSRA